MQFFQNSVKTAEFLDALQELKRDLLTLGDVPANERVYDYALNFFSTIKNFSWKYNIDNWFSVYSKKPSRNSMLIFYFNSWTKMHIRVPYKDKITLDKIYLSNDLVSLKSHQANPNQIIELLDIKKSLSNTRKIFLKTLESLEEDIKRPNELTLLLSGYYRNKTF